MPLDLGKPLEEWTADELEALAAHKREAEKVERIESLQAEIAQQEEALNLLEEKRRLAQAEITRLKRELAILEGRSPSRSRQGTGTTRAPTQRDDHYPIVLERLGAIDSLKQLDIGRTSYAVGKRANVMLRFSKADSKSRYTNYFIGLKAGHCRQLNQNRPGFLLVVLGNAEQVLVLAMGELLAWMEDVETYARDDWRLNFEQYPNGHILARTRGKAGWDVAHYLNRYDLLSSAKE